MWDNSYKLDKCENNFCFIRLAKLACKDYGFECDYMCDGDIEDVVSEFGKHTEEEHGIEYQKEVIMGFILRKNGA